MKKQLILAAALLAAAGPAAAAKWLVEVTNVTPDQTFTPVLLVTHYGDGGIFELGQPASDELSILAEGGDTGPLGTLLGTGSGRSAQTIDGLVMPGQSVKAWIDARPGQRLTLAAMLIPTNDTFIAVDSVFLPFHGETSLTVPAYDAGSEANDQSCVSIPGPVCGGEGYSPVNNDPVGFVHVSNGFHDLSSLDPAALSPVQYTWNNPVAIVTIRRVHGH
jgi:hypothetical protein